MKQHNAFLISRILVVFSKSDTQTKTNNCNIIQQAQWEKEKLLVFTIQADRFMEHGACHRRYAHRRWHR